MSEAIRRGLDGVVADITHVSKVMPDINALVYRGYPVQDLAEQTSFEEVAYLLWNGELPNQSQLDTLIADEKKNRAISDDLLNVIARYPKDAHPMDTLRTSVSFAGLNDEDGSDISEAAERRKAMRLWAKIPTMIAADARLRQGKDPIAPRDDLSMGANFFNMVFGEVPKDEVLRAFDVSMVLYAEHGFNASTFTGRVVASTLGEMYGAVAAAIAALKGPLHGGANEAVMHMLKEVGEPEKAKEWMLTALKEKRKIMGFGHRVYKRGDSRVPTMKKYADKMAEVVGDTKWQNISDILRDTMIAEKNIYPNLDFPAGPAYYLMGFDIPIFTPIFVMSRITGWTAHIIEQHQNNRLIRPLCKYEGPGERSIPAMGDR
ncbi:MAG: bifunctional 2-methylcitrate synthase/citrate synthase [Myxococcota bacterium]